MANLTLTLSQALSHAFSSYHGGRLIEAEQLCQQIVSAKPDLFDALHLLAVVQSGLGKKAAALSSYDRALAMRPDFAEALFNRGVALHELQRFAEALESYDRALAVGLDSAEAHSNRGNTLHQLERYVEALASYDRALAVRPDYAEALYNRGITLHELQRYEEALVSYDRALTVRPDLAEAHSNRGNALHELKRFEEALASYDRALMVRSDFADAHFNRGNSLKELKRFEEAIESYAGALNARPDYAEALANRGNNLKELKRYEEALASYDRALTVRPDNAETLHNLGIMLHELKRYEEALASYDRSLTLGPDNAETLSNRGITLKELKRFEDALASYDRALAARPDYAEAHWNEALLRLLIGDFGRGWVKYEWRWKNKTIAAPKRNFSQPLWLGADAIDRKTILLHSEQGFGDTIQFCRYVPLVAARGARVILEVERPLQELMTTVAGATQVVAKGNPLPDFDLQCPLLSLPLAFGTRRETIPSLTPYLCTPVRARNNWQTRFGPKTRARIGLVWSGNPGHKDDHNRSISLRSMMPLLDIDATFVSLQRNVRADDMAVLNDLTTLKERSDLFHFDDALSDFSDTAALISNLDLVISVDTSVAHLAGALAKPVWVLLTFVPDWRWSLDRDDSLWYPTARLFRQDETRKWDSVIARVRAALSEHIQRGRWIA